MKITDVTLTLFAWSGIPPTQYGKHTGRFGGKSQLGLLTVATDEGVAGQAFLGSAMRGAHLDGESLIQSLKPVVNFEVHHGGNSLNNVANLHVTMAIKNCEFFEVLLPAAAQKYGLVDDIEVDSNGLVRAMNGPGLGARIDFDLIERQKTAVLR